MLILAVNSLFDGFLKSNAIGQGIVYLQVAASVVMVSIVLSKLKQLFAARLAARKFQHEFTSCGGVLEYYLSRRPQGLSGMEGIYKSACERLLKIVPPQVRARLIGRQAGGEAGYAVLTAREIDLVKGTCEQKLSEEVLGIEYGMGGIAAVVALAPMLGLLGTVWGVLDAFAEMGSAGSANLATIAPSISAALVTTVVGLLVAMPGVIAATYANGLVRSVITEMEGFADELIGRMACEFQEEEL